jgi:hypothetical protein
MQYIKGYKLIGYSDLHPPYTTIISVPLKGAKFLTGFPLYAAHMVDNITAPTPLWLMLKEKGYVVPEGQDIVEPIIYK